MSKKAKRTKRNWLDNKTDKDVFAECSAMHQAGTFIREKHDPDQFHAGQTEATYRTVVSDSVKASLAEDLKNEAYNVALYYDAKQNSQLAALFPRVTSTLTVQGSGILPYGTVATSVQDLLLVAYDSKGAKVFAEDNSVLQSATYKGKPRFIKFHRPHKNEKEVGPDQ